MKITGMTRKQGFVCLIVILFTVVIVWPMPCNAFDRLNICGKRSCVIGDDPPRPPRERIERPSGDDPQRTRAQGLVQQGHALYDAGRYREALDLYLEAKRIWHNWGGEGIDQPIRNCRSMILIADADAAIGQRDYERAASLIREAQSINRKYAHLWEEKLGRCESNSYTKKGIDLINQGNYKEAEKMLTKAVKIDPKSSWAYSNLGGALYGQSRYREAEVFLRQAIQLDPNDSWTHNKLGEALENQNRYGEAEAAYRQAIKIDPGNSTAHRNLGDALRKQDRDTEAEAAYRQAIKLNPNSFGAHNGLGIALENQKRYAEAEAAYRQAIRIDPGDSAAHKNLGDALRQQNRNAEAEAAYRQAIKLNPNDSDGHSNLGFVLLNQKRYAESETAYRQVIKLDSKDADGYNALGVVLMRQGRYDEAKAAYQQALRLNPNTRFARNNLQELEKQQQEAKKESKAVADIRQNIDTVIGDMGRPRTTVGTVGQEGWKTLEEAKSADLHGHSRDPQKPFDTPGEKAPGSGSLAVDLTGMNRRPALPDLERYKKDPEIKKLLVQKEEADQKYNQLGKELKAINSKIANKEDNVGQLQVEASKIMDQMTAAKSVSDTIGVKMGDRVRMLQFSGVDLTEEPADKKGSGGDPAAGGPTGSEK